MALLSPMKYGFSPQAQECYLSYYLPERSQLLGTDLEKCLCSRLQLLADRGDFVHMMESRFQHQISVPEVNRRLEASRREWACYGLRLVAGREDLERLMEQLPVSQVVVNDVKVSRFQKS